MRYKVKFICLSEPLEYETFFYKKAVRSYDWYIDNFKDFGSVELYKFSWWKWKWELVRGVE